MDIYVVQPNDTINLIAERFGISVKKLIRDNELENPNELVTGQTIVIVYPKQVYTVQIGDTIESIAEAFTISQMQLLRNNPFLSNTPILPEEVLTISYNTKGKIATSGYIYYYIDRNILKKTLPYLTYITIYNYRNISEGKMISYSNDDSEVIKLCKEYGTIPLMMLTTLSAQGDPDIQTAYSILFSEEYQETTINETVAILKQKGYLGINLIFNYIHPESLYLYVNIVSRIQNRLEKEGYLFFITINLTHENNELRLEKIDYSVLNQLTSGITFIQFVWGTLYGPPSPVNSIFKISSITNYALTNIPPNKISVGVSLVSYDWQLPYIPGSSYANSLSLKSSLRLAQEFSAIIQFDNVSHSPFFNYIQDTSNEHIVWSVDARTISALVDLITQNELNGSSFWNLMTFTAQVWLVINSQLEIEKLIPNKFD